MTEYIWQKFGSDENARLLAESAQRNYDALGYNPSWVDRKNGVWVVMSYMERRKPTPSTPKEPTSPGQPEQPEEIRIPEQTIKPFISKDYGTRTDIMPEPLPPVKPQPTFGPVKPIEAKPPSILKQFEAYTMGYMSPESVIFGKTRKAEIGMGLQVQYPEILGTTTGGAQAFGAAMGVFTAVVPVSMPGFITKHIPSKSMILTKEYYIELPGGKTISLGRGLILSGKPEEFLYIGGSRNIGLTMIIGKRGSVLVEKASISISSLSKKTSASMLTPRTKIGRRGIVTSRGAGVMQEAGEKGDVRRFISYIKEGKTEIGGIHLVKKFSREPRRIYPSKRQGTVAEKPSIKMEQVVKEPYVQMEQVMDKVIHEKSVRLGDLGRMASISGRITGRSVREEQRVIGITRVDMRSELAEKTKTRMLTGATTRSELAEKTKRVPSTLVGTGQAQEKRVAPILGTSLRTSQRTRPLLEMPYSPTTPRSPRPPIRLIIPIMIGIPESSISRRHGRRNSSQDLIGRGTKYEPSLAGAISGRSISKAPKAELTGFGIRYPVKRRGKLI